MLNDDEIERAARQLAEYRSSNPLPQILDQYATLLEDYRRLRSDYEEERDARERYKQLARDQERNPFVLVLVDGDGYPFHERLLDKGADGGSTAAQLLNEAVKADLRSKGLEQCKIMIRIYANVAGLSKTLARAGLVGAEARSLGPFIASFNRSYGLADYLDAGELKENADFKLRALMQLYADNAQCKHMYLAFCHDVGYVADLTPYVRGYSNKFTLIKAPGTRFHTQFTKLGMDIVEFPGVFRRTPLETAVPVRPTHNASASAAAAAKADNVPPPRTPSTANRVPTGPSLSPGGGDAKQGNVCRFHAVGKCKYGKTCKNIHVDRAASSTRWRRSSPDDLVSDTNNSLQDPEDRISPGSNSQQSATIPAKDGTNHHQRQQKESHERETLELTRADSAFASSLPHRQDIPEGCIAVNTKNWRLDPYIPPSDPTISNRLNARINRHRVCNNFHLNATCDAGDSCEYDHSPLDAESRSALEFIARSRPCSKRGGCRNAKCTNGHICQNSRCKHYGGKAHCKLPFLSHAEDLTVDRFIPGDMKSFLNNIHNNYTSQAWAADTSSTSSNAGEDEADHPVSTPTLGEEEERGKLY
ncbi:hypothetical protein CSHISOI_09680 [Colletotrichum shisoi]|uniref:C3H1-type domain-containing protein n=1 Tax=Colletotrichum shisoi TaxID=2078593 RepID=A0A5Q4BFV2_9PEZI|nr:hypothetical protein CSHISOI_09680 [Colletotrichum shisoi]